MGSENPPLKVISKFVHLLDQSDLDFQEELEVARLREEVVTKIRANQQLEKDLNLMDIKIGLLVKNRITLEVSGVGCSHVSPPGVLGGLTPPLPWPVPLGLAHPQPPFCDTLCPLGSFHAPG